MKKKNKVEKLCMECGSQLEPLDNMDYHINPNICVSVLRDKLEEIDERREKLLLLCQKFISDNEIGCFESIYQSDRIILNSLNFIHKICDLVGYHKFNEEEK